MSLAVFDTLKLARRLEAAGMPPPQAASLAEGLAEVMTSELATKSDLKELRGWATSEFADLRVEFANVRQEMRVEFANVRQEMRVEFANIRQEVRTGFAELRVEIAQSKNETIRWMVGMFVAQTAVTLGALLRLVG